MEARIRRRVRYYLPRINSRSSPPQRGTVRVRRHGCTGTRRDHLRGRAPRRPLRSSEPHGQTTTRRARSTSRSSARRDDLAGWGAAHSLESAVSGTTPGRRGSVSTPEHQIDDTGPAPHRDVDLHGREGVRRRAGRRGGRETRHRSVEVGVATRLPRPQERTTPPATRKGQSMSNRKLPGGWQDNSDGTRSYVLSIGTVDPAIPRKQRRQARRTGGLRRVPRPRRDHRRPHRSADCSPPSPREYADSRDWPRPGSRERFDSSRRTLERPLGERSRIEQVNEPRIAALRSALGDEYKTSTANLRLHYATATMRYAYRQSYVATDVTKAVQNLRDRSGNVGVGPHNVPSRVGGDDVREAVDPTWRLLISLGASGLRIGEALGVHAEQFNDGELLVDRQLQRLGGVDTFPLPNARRSARSSCPNGAPPTSNGTSSNVARRRPPLPRSARSTPTPRRRLLVSLETRPRRRGNRRRTASSSTVSDIGRRRRCSPRARLAPSAPYLGDTVETYRRTYAHWCRDEDAISATILSRMSARNSRCSTERRSWQLHGNFDGRNAEPRRDIGDRNSPGRWTRRATRDMRKGLNESRLQATSPSPHPLTWGYGPKFWTLDIRRPHSTHIL